MALGRAREEQLVEQPVSTDDAKKLETEEVLTRLSSSEKGLTAAEAKERLAKYGLNEIIEKKENLLIKFLRYFWGPIPLMIEVAIVLSAIIGHWPDFFIIIALLAMNAVVGFWQERKASNAIELLKQRLAPNARVLRDGSWTVMPARELVPGDYVRVRLGDIVPADIKLVRGDYLMVDQSALTGESLPVELHAGNVGYAGAIVRQGEMNGVVVTTAMNTYFGRTTKLVEEARTVSHFQKNVVKIGNYLIVIDIILVAIVLTLAAARSQSLLDAFQFALVLTIAAIPVALPAVLSVTMAVGAVALAKKEAIVSKLVAIDELAGMDILCSDKTGTITKNELTLADVAALPGHKEEDVLVFATLASREEDNDPIDAAIIAKARESEANVQRLSGYEVQDFKPFDPVRKRTEATVLTSENRKITISKGAPQAIMTLVGEKDQVKEAVDKTVLDFARKGRRALGVAIAESEGHWRYVGLLALYDPPREDSAETIKSAGAMGVEVKMVTGDHVAIARTIAEQVGMRPDIAKAATFVDRPDQEAAEIVEKADGFAEVFPEHKYRIVELLQGMGHIVGMTGDGVNDAPALKKADAGIAVAGATDAAKSAADIVLTKPGLSVIIDSIKESRRIFQRMTNYSIYRISETIRVLFFITLSIVVLQFYPITALMIVLLALLNDLPILTISYDNVRYSSRPESWDMRILLIIATYIGIIGVASSFGLLLIGTQVLHLDSNTLQSFVYLKLSVAGHLCVFIARTKGPFWSIRPAWPLLLAVVVTQSIATIITVYGILLPSMGWLLAGIVWGYAFLMFLVQDAFKVVLYKYLIKRGLVRKGRLR